VKRVIILSFEMFLERISVSCHAIQSFKCLLWIFFRVYPSLCVFCALDEDECRDDIICKQERFPDVCNTELSFSLKSGSRMEFLPFSCEEDDLAPLELLSMLQ